MVYNIDTSGQRKATGGIPREPKRQELVRFKWRQ